MGTVTEAATFSKLESHNGGWAKLVVVCWHPNSGGAIGICWGWKYWWKYVLHNVPYRGS